MHDFIPIFSSYDTEQDHDTSRSTAKVGLPKTTNYIHPFPLEEILYLPAKTFAIFDSAEEDTAG